jgi:uncharacterized protein (TIGR03083 family)
MDEARREGPASGDPLAREDARAGEGLRLLRHENEATYSLLDSLAPVEWDAPSTCPPWSVRTLVAHVVRSGEHFLASIRNGQRGILDPPFPPEYRVVRMNEIAAQEPAKIVADLRAVDTDFADELESLRPDRLGTLAYHTYRSRTMPWYIDHRLAEVAFHRWDVAQSLGRPALLDEAVAAHLLPMLLEENVPAYLPRRAADVGGTFRLIVSGAPGPSWTVHAPPGAAGERHVTVARGETGAADVTIDGDPATLALLIYGRRTLPNLEAAGLIAVSGDRALAERFAEVFAGP